MRVSKHVLKQQRNKKALDSFQHYQEKGAKEFGGLWLKANTAAVEQAIYAEVDYADPQIKQMLSGVAYHVLAHSRYFYEGFWEKKAEAPCPTK